MRKRFFFFVLGICFLTIFIAVTVQAGTYDVEILELSQNLSSNIEKEKKHTVAVVDFTDLQGNITELGRFIAEELSANLVAGKKNFVVIDRIHLKHIIAEHKLSVSAFFDPKAVDNFGKISGVDAIIIGVVTPFGDSVRVSAKVIATDSARIIAASTGSIARTAAIEELLGKGIEMQPQTTVREKSSRESTKSKGKPAPLFRKVESNNFTFELLKCKISGGSMSCHLLITNGEKDRKFELNALSYGSAARAPSSRCFDSSGSEYIADKARVGSTQGGIASTMLVSGVPTKASLSFKNISTQDKMLSLLELSCHAGEWFKVQFRNVLLE